MEAMTLALKYELTVNGKQAYWLNARPMNYRLPAGFLQAAKVDVEQIIPFAIHGLGSVLVEEVLKNYTIVVSWDELFGEAGQFWLDRLSAGVSRSHLFLYALRDGEITPLLKHDDFATRVYGNGELDGAGNVFLLRNKMYSNEIDWGLDVGREILPREMWVMLNSGKLIGIPLDNFPGLATATQAQLNDYVVTDISIRWPQIEMKISVDELLANS